MRHLRLLRINRGSKALLALSAVIFIYTFATSILQYNLSLFTESLSANYTIFGLIMGLPWIFSLLTDMPTGVLADRFGRKRTMILGLLGLGASGILFYIVSGIFQLFWVLVFFGVFEGFLTVAGMASVIVSSPKGKENQFVGGYLNASALGYFIGPLAAGVIVFWSESRLPFLFFSVICFIAAAFAYLFIRRDGGKEPLVKAVADIFCKDRIYVAELKEFFSVGRLSIFVGFFMLLSGMWSEFIWAMEPVFIQALNFLPLIGGIILSAFVAPFAVLDYPVGRWIDRTQRRFFSMIAGLLAGGRYNAF